MTGTLDSFILTPALAATVPAKAQNVGNVGALSAYADPDVVGYALLAKQTLVDRPSPRGLMANEIHDQYRSCSAEVPCTLRARVIWRHES
jgi:hypothetical protein